MSKQMKTLYTCRTTVITFDSDTGLVEQWTAPEYPSTRRTKVFKRKDGTKVLLSTDNGSRWNRERKEANSCWYGQLWFGEYPYGSWCLAIRVDKTTNVMTFSTFDTEINYSGQLPVDRWEEDCKAYVS